MSSSLASSCSIFVVSSPSRTAVSALDFKSCWVCAATFWLSFSTSSLLEDLRSSAWICFWMSFIWRCRASMSLEETQAAPARRAAAERTRSAGRRKAAKATWP